MSTLSFYRVKCDSGVPYSLCRSVILAANEAEVKHELRHYIVEGSDVKIEDLGYAQHDFHICARVLSLELY